MYIVIILIVVVAWVIYQLNAIPKRRSKLTVELHILSREYGLSDHHVFFIQVYYINKNKFYLFNKIKEDLGKINASFSKYTVAAPGTYNEFKTNCCDYICSSLYEPNNGFEKFVDNLITRNRNIIANRPLPITVVKTEKILVPEYENIEEFDLPQELDGLKLNVLAQIRYKDAKGQQSERRITMKSISKSLDGDYNIMSHCHEKEAQRTFKLSRISMLVDIETGEMFENAKDYFIDRFEDTPLGLITKCIQQLEDEVLVLTFLARSDGFLRKKERDIINSFIVEESGMYLDVLLLDDEIRRTYCDNKDFRSALKKVTKKSLPERLRIVDAANNIISTDKKSDPMEIGILELIKTECNVIE